MPLFKKAFLISSYTTKQNWYKTIAHIPSCSPLLVGEKHRPVSVCRISMLDYGKCVTSVPCFAMVSLGDEICTIWHTPEGDMHWVCVTPLVTKIDKIAVCWNNSIMLYTIQFVICNRFCQKVWPKNHWGQGDGTSWYTPPWLFSCPPLKRMSIMGWCTGLPYQAKQTLVTPLWFASLCLIINSNCLFFDNAYLQCYTMKKARCHWFLFQLTLRYICFTLKKRCKNHFCSLELEDHQSLEINGANVNRGLCNIISFRIQRRFYVTNKERAGRD